MSERVSGIQKKKQTRVLYPVTALVMVVFIAFGLASWLVFRQSQERLVEKSKGKLIQSAVDDITATVDYVSSLLTPMFLEKLGSMKPEEAAEAFLAKRITEAQHEINLELQRSVQRGLPGQKIVMVILMPTAVNTDPLVYLCSDESLVYRWEVPDYLVQAVEDNRSYLWMEDGVPELNLTGPHILAINKLEDTGMGFTNVTVTVKSMQAEISDVDDFFREERRNANLMLGLAFFVSLGVVIIISFFVLSYLLRKRITEPIEELADAAGQVMEGNLDVEINVHEGGDFAILERAFKEMVESFRKYIARSVGEE